MIKEALVQLHHTLYRFVEQTESQLILDNCLITCARNLNGRSVSCLSIGLTQQCVKKRLCCLIRLLNSLPASRMSATALEAFLKTAGFRLNAAFGRQFHKLLAYIDTVFMPDLAKQGDPDARAVHSRLHTYMHDRLFLKEPEGRRMPFSDISTREHA